MANIGELLAEIGARHGIEIAMDADGACTLPLDDGRFMQIQLRESADELDLVATLGAIPEPVRGPVFETLLAANFYWRETLGATLSWNRELEQAVIAYPLPLSADAATVENAFGNFLQLQREWAGRLRDDIAEAGECAAEAAAEDADGTAPERPAENVIVA